MKAIGFAALFVLFVAMNCLGQAKCKEYSAASSVLAFCPPAGWAAVPQEKKKHPNFEQKAAAGKLGTILTVDEDEVAGGYDELAMVIMKGTFESKAYTHRIIADLVDFKTASGLEGVKFIIVVKQSGVALAQHWYIINGPKDVKFTFQVISDPNDETLDAILDKAIKTVRVKN